LTLLDIFHIVSYPPCTVYWAKRQGPVENGVSLYATLYSDNEKEILCSGQDTPHTDITLHLASPDTGTRDPPRGGEGLGSQCRIQSSLFSFSAASCKHSSHRIASNLITIEDSSLWELHSQLQEDCL
jgi:hypothetical protein